MNNRQEEMQKMDNKERYKHSISRLYAPLFFIFGVVILCFCFNFFEWRANSFAFLKNVFLIKTVNFFALQELEITGNSHVSDDKIKEILCREIECNELLNNNIFLFPLQKIQAELSYLDWVENARISRHLPDKISVKIIEKKPLAKWKITNSENVYLVDENGLIFKRFEGENMTHIPTIKNSFGKINFLVDIIKKNDIIALGIFEIERRDFWHIKLMDGLVLKVSLQQMEDFSNTIKKLENNYQIFAPENSIELIDFHDEKRVYVKHKKK